MNDWYLNFDRALFSNSLSSTNKAFDTVYHDVLIAKLRFYGNEGMELE